MYLLTPLLPAGADVSPVALLLFILRDGSDRTEDTCRSVVWEKSIGIHCFDAPVAAVAPVTEFEQAHSRLSELVTR